MLQKRFKAMRARVTRFYASVESIPWVFVLCAAGVALRAVGMTSGPLWYDEAFSVMAARLGLLEMVQALRGNISPPGWEIVLWFVTRLLGRNALAFRSVPLLASVFALIIFWRLTRALRLTRAQQLFGLAVLALAPYQLWIAQEARMYSIMSLLYLLGLLWAIEGKYLGLTAVMGLLLWLHNVALFFVLPLGLLAGLLHPRDWKLAIAAGVIALCAWLPWLPTLFNQAQTLQAALTPLAPSVFIFTFWFDLFASALPWTGMFGLAILLTSMALAALVSLAWLGAWIRRGASTPANGLSFDLRVRWDDLIAHRNSWVPVYAFGLPLLLFLLCNLFYQNVLTYRPGSALLPPLALWLAVTLIPARVQLIHWIMPTLWLALLVWALLGWSPNDRGSNLSQVVDLLKREWSAGDIIYHDTDLTAVLFAYYFPDQPAYVIDENDLAGGKGIVDEIQIPVMRAALEQIPHRRAWLVRTVYHLEPERRPSEWRMRAYTQACPLVGAVSYWQAPEIDVYLCDAATPPAFKGQ